MRILQLTVSLVHQPWRAGNMDDVDVIAEALHEAAVDVDKFVAGEVQQTNAAILFGFGLESHFESWIHPPKPI